MIKKINIGNSIKCMKILAKIIKMSLQMKENSEIWKTLKSYLTINVDESLTITITRPSLLNHKCLIIIIHLALLDLHNMIVVMQLLSPNIHLIATFYWQHKHRPIGTHLLIDINIHYNFNIHKPHLHEIKLKFPTSLSLIKHSFIILIIGLF